MLNTRLSPNLDSQGTRMGGQGKTIRLMAGLLFSSGIGLAAYKRRSLSRNGVAGAVFTGATIFGMGGLSWGLSLIYFFLSSTLLSHFREQDKAEAAADKFSKGSQRDLGQVLANGGAASLFSIGYGLACSSRQRGIMQAGFIGALATATADTWATETGVLSPQSPRLITTGQTVQPGTSGGITFTGTIASALGAVSLGLCFWLLQREKQDHVGSLPISLVSGLTGSLFDSFLGATMQAMYYCPTCQKETERKIHSCGTTTQPLRGISWLDNDLVNLLATLWGSLIAILLSRRSD